jgi:multimeric flavodoxin WrbA
MARLLAVLCSGRREGYTASLLQAAVEGASEVQGVEVRPLWTHDYSYGPCRSCFACIRSEDHTCVQPDDFGRSGEGEVFQELAAANGMLLADPVHNWGPSASSRLLVERCYPFLWSGRLNGLPFGSISCASNQGMQMLAAREICKWAFGLGFRYMGGIAAHCAILDEARREAEALGRRVAHAALHDADKGREPFDDEAKYLYYAREAPWAALDAYVENLTRGTGRWEQSLIRHGLVHGTFQRPEARELLEEALPVLKQALYEYHQGNREEATRELVRASALWTHATWKEFLEEEVIGVSQPDAYRPLD